MLNRSSQPLTAGEESVSLGLGHQRGVYGFPWYYSWVGCRAVIFREFRVSLGTPTPGRPRVYLEHTAISFSGVPVFSASQWTVRASPVPSVVLAPAAAPPSRP